MFTLSSADLNLPHRSNSEIHIPIQIETSNEKYPTVTSTHDTTAACDDDGHIFVYDTDPPQSHEHTTGKVKILAFSRRSISLSSSYNTKKNRAYSTVVINM